MNESVHDVIVGIFAKTAHLSHEKIPLKVANAIYLVAAPYYLFVQSLEPSGVSNSIDPIDGILITLMDRLFKSVSGCLSLCALSAFQQAEVLSRTVMESAVTLEYLLAEETDVRIIRYFDAFIKQERSQIQKWEKELVEANQDIVEDHKSRIKNKFEIYDGYEKFLVAFSSNINVSYPNKKGWPNFYDICKAIGKGIDYRTVYMAMCSQAHHDAEDILNNLMAGLTEESSGFSQRMEREKDHFSIYLVLLSCRYYLEALLALSEKYNFHPPVKESNKSLQNLFPEIQSILNGIDVDSSLKGWVHV